MTKRNGFTAIEALLVVAALVIVGGVGYMAYANLIAPKDTATTVESSESSTPATTVTDTSDLDKVDRALDELSIDDSESTELDELTTSF